MLDFQLNLVSGYMIFHTLGVRPETQAAFARAEQIAIASQDDAQLALAYSAKWMGAYNRGEPAKMLEFAERFEQLTQTRSDPEIVLMYDRMKSATFHFLGDQRSARACCRAQPGCAQHSRTIPHGLANRPTHLGRHHSGSGALAPGLFWSR